MPTWREKRNSIKNAYKKIQLLLATLVSELDRIKLERKDPFAPLSEEYKDKLYEAYKMVRPYVEKDWDLFQ